jgi:von Willebrand factor type A domain.
MGLFGLFGGNKKDTTAQSQSQSQSMGESQPSAGFAGLNMNKEQSVQLLNMRKETVNLLCMEKKGLSNVKARVGVAMDYSGSMEDEYLDGLVQATIERILPLALRFDDNGELDMWLFDDNFRSLPTVTTNNFYGYVQKEILDKKYRMGGTNYAPVMKDIMSRYMKKEPSDMPTYILFVTDGDNSDKAETERVIRESANHNIFWQFVGIGNARFSFLQMLDDLKGRPIDNTDFFAIKDINNTPDQELYKNLLNEYPGWEAEARRLGMIK